jgi:Cellulase (glycosyl hydrolase family 5)
MINMHPHSHLMHLRIIRWLTLTWVVMLACCLNCTHVVGQDEPMESIGISSDGKGFVYSVSKTPFRVHGFNYDHDASGALIEDYWEAEWERVEQDFAEMKSLGANVVRVHLQFAKFMNSAEVPNPESLKRLERLLRLAERERLYLDLTGLGCYHAADVPDWYDQLDEGGRWKAQARFWKAVADVSRTSPAVFCYDLMNEPVVPGGKREDKQWLGGAFAGKHFVQFISLDSDARERPEIAKQWIETLVSSIREVDSRTLITVGLVDWSLDRKGLTSGFVPSKIADRLDFISFHLYPTTGMMGEAMETLKGFDLGKPLLLEETFPLKCSSADLREFLKEAEPVLDGSISFYWGETVAELEAAKRLEKAILAEWLKEFEQIGSSSKVPAKPDSPR